MYNTSNVVLTTASEIKPFVKATVNHYKIGSYVKVIEDYSRSFNYLSGYGYIKRITNNGMDIKYTPAANNCHKAGWYCRYLLLNPRLEESSKSTIKFNKGGLLNLLTGGEGCRVCVYRT